MNEEIKSVIAKANKLFALAENNSNPNEAANAAYQAQKLLEKHKLTRAAIAAASADEDEEDVIEHSTPLERVKRATWWKEFLAAAICSVNGCEALWVRESYSVKVLKIVGRSSDIEVVRWFYSSVVAQIEALCKGAMIAGQGRGKRWSNSFKQGATSTVINRLKAAKQEVRKEYQQTAALVLVERREEDVKNWITKHRPGYTPKGSSRFSITKDAYSQGREAGNRVDLSRAKLNNPNKGLLA